MNKTRLKLVGRCEMILRGPNGNIKDRQVIENDLSNNGFDLIAALLANPTPPAGYSAKLTYLGIGWGVGANTAFNAAQTDLQGASKDRKSATYSHTLGTKIFYLQSTWGPNEPLASTVPIEEVGSFNASTAGAMFSRLVRPMLNKQAVDTLEVNYSFEWAMA